MKQTVFRKVYTKDRLPSSFGEYFTDLGLSFYNNGKQYWTNDIKGRSVLLDVVHPEWWLEEVDFNCEHVSECQFSIDRYREGYNDGIKYMLNLEGIVRG